MTPSTPAAIQTAHAADQLGAIIRDKRADIAALNDKLKQAIENETVVHTLGQLTAHEAVLVSLATAYAEHSVNLSGIELLNPPDDDPPAVLC